MIKESSIQEVLSRADIIDMVSPYTTLNRKGSKWLGLSPFNPGEKTPSFYIDPAKNLYYCFSSEQGGDIIKFVQQKQNLNYREATEFLASRYNIELQYEAIKESSIQEVLSRADIVYVVSLYVDLKDCCGISPFIPEKTPPSMLSQRRTPITASAVGRAATSSSSCSR